MSDVVTGDAVVVDVQIAQLPIRAGARLIDGLIQVALLLAGGFGLAMIGGQLDPDTAILNALVILMIVLVTVGYPLVFEALTRGRTPGKMALGLRVVADDGGPERFRQALYRALSGSVEIYILSAAPAVICSLLHPRGKRLGDVFAGTVVISERGPRRTAPPPVMPPMLAAWAATLELSGLTEELAAMARQYLARLPQLNPAAQYEMGRRIAAQVATVVAPPPPPGVPPHLYLAAVLAERRHRESARLAQAMRATAAPAVEPYQPPPAPAPTPAPESAPGVTPGGFAPPA
ncbi:RDD family protein [Acrocarpospora catenulata]|uniref:RDD family protein n=1 Tax=Acrocarpospora catenulata TaxID=2836182 RepID=UPI001BDADC0E|nr:RDD family protein [Acrocarpospora catenulata]